LIHGGRVYVSGQVFAGIPGSTSTSGLFAISRTTLQVVNWHPVVPRTHRDGGALAAVGDRLFVSGLMQNVSYPPEPLNAVDTLTGAAAACPGPLVSTGGSELYAIAGGKLFASGPHQMTMSMPRFSLAEIDLASGACTDRTFDLLPNEPATVVA